MLGCAATHHLWLRGASWRVCVARLCRRIRELCGTASRWTAGVAQAGAGSRESTEKRRLRWSGSYNAGRPSWKPTGRPRTIYGEKHGEYNYMPTMHLTRVWLGLPKPAKLINPNLKLQTTLIFISMLLIYLYPNRAN